MLSLQQVQASGDRQRLLLQDCVPKTFEPSKVEDAIRKVLPSFVEIYDQSSEAERLGLDQICGCGLRRSLEFLIKDYLIQKEPGDADSAKSRGTRDIRVGRITS
jgi:hypothetical protein